MATPAPASTKARWRLRLRRLHNFSAPKKYAGIIQRSCPVRTVRYHFSNRSDDIRDLFTAALNRLGIAWTRPSQYVIAAYRKAAVARLDEFVGPKS